ncbi:hypothetical protein HZH68_005073 [Vespula germanica]|uniref:Uncharacterized protein n=1 Tax=Vespula germanica TaxID=30212 RepID=A0A834KJ13_VESGE|nr:hypothetical protein HZH68_005073 [Vespula germanica]
MGNMAQNCAGERASPVRISQETHSYGNATESYPTLPFSIEFSPRDTTPRAVAMYRPNGKIILRRISLLCDFTKHRRREEPQRLWFSLRPRVRFTMEESSFDVRKRTVSADGFFAISFRSQLATSIQGKAIARAIFREQ